MPEAVINYVWDNRYPVGTEMPNAYNDRTRMIVQQQGEVKARQWVTARRNVVKDAEGAFGKHDFGTTLLAVATDTDNTGESARAGFADLHFVGENEPCDFL